VFEQKWRREYQSEIAQYFDWPTHGVSDAGIEPKVVEGSPRAADSKP
jgi:hypothetical protein